MCIIFRLYPISYRNFFLNGCVLLDDVREKKEKKPCK